MSAHRKKHPSDFKTQYGLGLNQQNDEIVADFFCGGGGAGTGTGTGLGMGLGRAVTVAKTQLVHMCGNSVSPPADGSTGSGKRSVACNCASSSSGLTAAEDLRETSNSYFGLLCLASNSQQDRSALPNVVLRRGNSVNAALTKTYLKVR